MIENLESTTRDFPEVEDGLTETASVTSAISAPLPLTDDPARHVGELFRRLAMASKTFCG